MSMETPAFLSRLPWWRASLWLFLALHVAGAPGTHAAAPRRVLVVHSFGREFAPFDTMSSTFRTELARQSPEPLEFSEVAIETARFAGATNDQPLVDYVRALQVTRPLDLMIAVAEPATHFFVRNRAALFPETPLIAHVDHRQARLVETCANTTLVPVIVRLPVLLENILELLPRTTNVAWILGASPFERMWADQCRRELDGYSGRVTVHYLNDLTLDQMREYVSALPGDSAVLYAMLAIDAAGVPHEQEQALARLRAASAAPVFGVFESQLGHGIVGGSLLSLEQAGRQAAGVALQLLRGERVAAPVEASSESNRRSYDGRELDRWRIDEARLPPGSDVRFRSPSLWQEHRGPILAAAAVILAQVITIAALLANRARRRRSETGLRESEARMNLAVEAANLGLWSWDFASDEIWATAKCRELFGFLAHERVTFADFAARVHADDRPAMERAVRRALEASVPYDTEYRACLPDGRLRWIAARGVAAREEGGGGRRMLGVCIDLTGKKRAEEESERQRSELAHVARVSTMGALAASLAHELNQPLGAILSNAEAAELLLDHQPLPLADLREILADIRRDDERAGEVIRKMRALLRRRELERQPLDLNAVVGEVLRLVAADAALRKTTVNTDLAPSLPAILGDRVHLQQVLLNLVLNGFEAMGASGTDERRLAVRTRPTAGGIEVSVTDSGPGIRPEIQARLFEPFFTTKTDGMGMGLSIARTIVEAHQGTIGVRSHPSGGATFHFILPEAKAGLGS